MHRSQQSLLQAAHEAFDGRICCCCCCCSLCLLGLDWHPAPEQFPGFFYPPTHLDAREFFNSREIRLLAPQQLIPLLGRELRQFRGEELAFLVFILERGSVCCWDVPKIAVAAILFTKSLFQLCDVAELPGGRLLLASSLCMCGFTVCLGYLTMAVGGRGRKA